MFFLKRRRSSLDDVLGHWSPTDPITVRTMCQNMAVLGRSGGGKSSGSGDYLLRCLVRYPNSCGVILASKPEDKDYARRLFREEGRSKDLLIMEPGGEHRFNLLDYEMKSGADTAALTQALMIVSEIIERTEGMGEGSREPFWRKENRRQLHHAIEIVSRATGRVDPCLLQGFITGAALSLEETADERWKASPHYQALKTAEQNAKTPIQQNDFRLSQQYWQCELPSLNDRTRSSITTGVMGLLFVLNSGTVRDLLATETTVSPETLEDRRQWLLVNMPIVPGDASAAVVNAAVKYAVQHHILRRKAGPYDPLFCLFSDEFQKVANSYDAAYLAECRSHKGMLIALTQSMHALYANLGGKGGEHQTDSLLTNFGHLVIHTLGDAQSAEMASSLLGRRREMFIGTSMTSEPPEPWEVICGRSPVSVSMHESYEPVLQPAVFLSGLRTGGPPDNMVDGIVIRSGAPFNATSENYLIRAFKQR